MKTHISAGGVLYNPATKKIYLVRKKIRDEWLLPKGHIEEGEDIRAAALREIKEETGYANVELGELLGRTEFEFIENSEQEFKVVYYYFALLADDTFEQTQAQQEEGLNGKWVLKEEALKLTKFKDVRQFITKAYEVC